MRVVPLYLHRECYDELIAGCLLCCHVRAPSGLADDPWVARSAISPPIDGSRVFARRADMSSVARPYTILHEVFNIP